MATCFDTQLNRYVYCSSSSTAYIAVGIIIPIVVFVIILLSVYLRCKRSQLGRQQQQINTATIVPIYNNDEQHQEPYQQPYPPHYAASTSNPNDKPPSYEQSLRQLEASNNRSENTPAVLPVTTNTESSTDSVEATRHQKKSINTINLN